MSSEGADKVDFERIRMFQSPLLERWMLTSPTSISALWIPIILLLFFMAASSPLWGTGAGLAWACAGLLVFTPLEYATHRFLFHWRARSERGRRMVDFMHGVHHKQLNDPMRTLMPPMMTLPLAVFFFAITALFLDRPWLEAAFGGFLIGYLAYDLIHWGCHNTRMPTRLGRALKRYHLRHHYDRRPGNYGVSSPLWDFLLGTRLPK